MAATEGILRQHRGDECDSTSECSSAPYLKKAWGPKHTAQGHAGSDYPGARSSRLLRGQRLVGRGEWAERLQMSRAGDSVSWHWRPMVRARGRFGLRGMREPVGRPIYGDEKRRDRAGRFQCWPFGLHAYRRVRI